MYFSPTKVHPSVQIVLDRQKAGKPTRKLLSEQEEARGLILEGAELDAFEDIIVPLDGKHAFILNENDVYELVRLDEGWIGNMIKGALKWLHGNVGKLLGKWFPDETDQQKLYKAYQNDPKKALDYVRNRMAGQGLKPEQIDREVKKIRNGINREIAARHGVKTRDANMINAISGIGKALEKSGNDPAAQMAAVRQMMSSGAAGQTFKEALQKLTGGGVPAKGGKAQPPAQPQAQQPAAAQPPAAQQPAKQKTKDGKFFDGDEVSVIDPKTNQVLTGHVKILNKDNEYGVVSSVIDPKTNAPTTYSGALEWTLGKTPKPPVAAAQPPATSQTQGPGGKLPPGDIQIGGSYILNGTKVDIKPGSLSTNMEGVASLVKQYKTGKVSGIVDGQEVELDSLTASGGELGANLSLAKAAAAPAQGAAQPAAAQPAGGLTNPETGPAATPAAQPAKPAALTPTQIAAQQAAAKPPVVMSPETKPKKGSK